MAATTKIFDASLQREVDYTLAVDRNGEIVAQSTESENVVKIPAGLTKKQVESFIAKHRTANDGQQVLSAEEVDEREKNLEKSRQVLRDFGATDADIVDLNTQTQANDPGAKKAPVGPDDRSGKDGQTLQTESEARAQKDNK